jgi:hypothetical protein
MNLSLNEIEALTKRAARGAGMSWGMSEEAGKATRWLASHGLPGADLLVDTLAQNDGVPHSDIAPAFYDDVWKARSGVLCPLISGAALNDCADKLAAAQPIIMANVCHPLLAVPFAAWAAIHIKAPITVSWLDTRCTTDGFGLQVDGPLDQIEMRNPVLVTCAQAADRVDTITAPGLRGDVNDTTWARLNAFAHRTYARATDESRALGAGAGISDND